jgi:hypothetical protein
LGGTALAWANYRGLSWRVMSVYAPLITELEDPLAIGANSNSAQQLWAQLESGTLAASQSYQCGGTLRECGGGKKLTNLTSGQAISINLTGNVPGNTMPATSNEPISIAFRYSRNQLLGNGQCHPDAGCAGTTASQCASGLVTSNGCFGGVANPGKLGIWVQSNRPGTGSWSYVHGNTYNAPYGKNIFPPTSVPSGSIDVYSTAYIYPVYLQDTAASIAGYGDKNGTAASADTARVWIVGDTANGADAPAIDIAYFFPGAPPDDADCKGPGGCWLFAGPNDTVTVAQGGTYTYTSPNLPPGTYTFRLANVTGDADLYVKTNGVVSTSNYTCRSVAVSGQPESCTVVLGGRGGTISAMVYGFSAGNATATLIGSN